MRTFDRYHDVLAEVDGDDERTVGELRQALASVEFDHPIAAITDEANPARRRGNRWYLAAAAVTTVIVTGVVVSNIGGSTENVAFAEWTYLPQAVTDLERAQIEAACDSAAQPPSDAPTGTVAESGDAGSAVAVPELAEHPSFEAGLIDRRGNIAAVVATSDEVVLDCAAHFSNGEWYAFAAGVGWGGDSAGPTVSRAWSRAWNGNVEITMISGLAPGATSVEIDAPGLVSGTAPVVDDRYVLWIPSSSTWNDDTSINVRNLDANGTVIATVDLDVGVAPG